MLIKHPGTKRIVLGDGPDARYLLEILSDDRYGHVLTGYVVNGGWGPLKLKDVNYEWVVAVPDTMPGLYADIMYWAEGLTREQRMATLRTGIAPPVAPPKVVGMVWTFARPTTPGWYWFKRAGDRRSKVPELVRVYPHKGHLCFHTGAWPGTNFADHDRLDQTAPEHRWSSMAIPEPSAMSPEARKLAKDLSKPKKTIWDGPQAPVLKP